MYKCRYAIATTTAYGSGYTVIRLYGYTVTVTTQCRCATNRNIHLAILYFRLYLFSRVSARARSTRRLLCGGPRAFLNSNYRSFKNFVFLTEHISPRASLAKPQFCINAFEVSCSVRSRRTSFYALAVRLKETEFESLERHLHFGGVRN